MEELLNLIIDTLEGALILPYSIKVGQVDEDGGISALYGPGSTDKTFLTKGIHADLILLFTIKDRSMKTCLNTLDNICKYLEMLQIYPQLPPTDGTELINIMTTTRPNEVDKEDNGMYIYSAIVTLKIAQ